MSLNKCFYNKWPSSSSIIVYFKNLNLLFKLRLRVCNPFAQTKISINLIHENKIGEIIKLIA
jgi:hypothetical protein